MMNSRFRAGLAGILATSAVVVASTPMLSCEKPDRNYTSVTNSASGRSSGSGGSSEENSPSYANPSATFSIDSPSSGASIEKDIITIKGSGIKREVADFLIFVHTDRWWGQAGRVQLGNRGEWSYSPVYLRGRDNYNNHSIKAIVNYQDGGEENAQVDGIIRTGPLTGP